jgi:hypothetical protein
MMTDCDVCGGRATVQIEWVPVGGSKGVEDRVCSVCGSILLDLGSIRDVTVTDDISTPDFGPSL